MFGALALYRVRRNSQARESINQSFHYRSAYKPQKCQEQNCRTEQPRTEGKQANAESFVRRK